MNFESLKDDLFNAGKAKGTELAENFLSDEQSRLGEGSLAGTGIGFGKQMLENLVGGNTAQPTDATENLNSENADFNEAGADSPAVTGESFDDNLLKDDSGTGASAETEAEETSETADATDRIFESDLMSENSEGDSVGSDNPLSDENTVDNSDDANDNETDAEDDQK